MFFPLKIFDIYTEIIGVTISFYLLSTDDIPINREIPSVESRYETNTNAYDLCISAVFNQWVAINILVGRGR